MPEGLRLREDVLAHAGGRPLREVPVREREMLRRTWRLVGNQVNDLRWHKGLDHLKLLGRFQPAPNHHANVEVFGRTAAKVELRVPLG